MKFSLYKRSSRSDSKRKKAGVWYLRYQFEGMPTSKSVSLGVTDRQVANSLAAEFRKEKERELAGMLPPKRLRDAAKKTLSEHVADYIGDRERRGKGLKRNGKDNKQVKKRLNQLFSENAWKRFADVSADGFVTWRNSSKVGAATLNHFRAEAITFFEWCRKLGRIDSNPLKDVSKIDVRADSKRQRRALTEDELIKLLDSVPAYRRIVYFMASRTGLRWGELNDLLWRDVDLSGSVGTVTVVEGSSKNKRREALPLVPELFQALKAHKPADAVSGDKVFVAGVPRARTLEKDLEEVGIPYRDKDGCYADFHSLRYSWATFMAVNDVPPAIAMRLMRHSTIDMTTKLYTDEKHLPLRKAVESLPSLEKSRGTQIGTLETVPEGQIESQPVSTDRRESTSKDLDYESVRRLLSSLVSGGQMVEVAGVEPASLEPSHKASTCLFSFLISPLGRDETALLLRPASR